ncbi:MAG: 2-oxoacid:ferredoxin oxidoreductase subunit beta [bacterium]|jgi:2-oxoglutarate ferredoxin oxidoreductase subunit beta|nr:2-oxoacid:ferredoxin oxidoreductase subunit beta [Planctomycetota bacterium]HIL50769.1 2-oxoacid:ferredoxin oxidoreductase subunit beta [Planctomycetota bacterium]
MNDTLTKKDFKSDQEVRWCPGCGDYAILNVVQKACATIGKPKDEVVFVSGIGCSSRFPYYMDTYGFHTIHGRAPAVATGVKTANPDLSVWVVTGDGDALSIGGNHLAHILRRNLDINILLFNNEIYGLTKGQYSPTSPSGTRTKTSPMGSVDRPFNPISFALGCNATFVARTADNNLKHMSTVLEAAAAHKGTSFIEIYQNCVIFNDGAFEDVINKKVRDDRTVDLEPGQPMIYGKQGDKGLRADGFNMTRCAPEEASVWNPGARSAAAAFTMSTLDQEPAMPNPIGIFRCVEDLVFEDEVASQVSSAIASKGRGSLQDLIYAGETWKIE